MVLRQMDADAVQARAKVEQRIDDMLRKAQAEKVLEQREMAHARALPRIAEGARATQLAGGAEPGAIALNAKDVFWVNAGRDEILAAPRAGGATRVLVSGQKLAQPRHATVLAADASNVYWIATDPSPPQAREPTAVAQGVAIRRVSASGGEVQTLIDGLSGLSALTVTKKVLFFVRAESSSEKEGEPVNAPEASIGESTGGVHKLNPSTNATTLLVQAQSPCAIASDEGRVYVVDGRSIFSVSIAGGNATRLIASSGPLGCSLAVDKNHIYYTVMSDGSVMKARKHDGAEPTVLAIEPVRPAALALAGTTLYSLTESAPRALGDMGAVWRVSIEGGRRADVLATDEVGLNAIAADGNDVFYTKWDADNGEGGVMHIPAASTFPKVE